MAARDSIVNSMWGDYLNLDMPLRLPVKDTIIITGNTPIYIFQEDVRVYKLTCFQVPIGQSQRIAGSLDIACVGEGQIGADGLVIECV